MQLLFLKIKKMETTKILTTANKKIKKLEKIDTILKWVYNFLLISSFTFVIVLLIINAIKNFL